MDKKRGFVGIGLILAIVLGVAVVGGGAYYLGKNDLKQEAKIEKNILQNNDEQSSENNSHLTIIESKTYGYSIGYSGIESKYVYTESDGKKVKLFPNQSNIDNLEIIDSTYVMPKNVSSVGMVTFGANEYKKFKDSITPRHTYYLKSGLKNNKSILISVENDSDNPNYFDLSSLRIDTLNSSEESTTEVFTNQPGDIKSIKTNGANNWVLAVDLLSRNPNWVPGVEGSGPFFLNQNTKIRDLNLTNSTKAYNCGEGPDGNPTTADVAVSNTDFINDIQSSEYKKRYFNINGTNIVTIYQQCLP